MKTDVNATLERNLTAIRERIAIAARRAGRLETDVELIAVTKTVSPAVALALCELGQRRLAENRPQCLWEKAAALPKEVRWHMIGHLQTNKVRRTIPLLEMFHALDRTSLAEYLSGESARLGRTLPVLLEVNVTGETSKHGFSRESIREEFERLCALPGIEILGLMTMARPEEDPERCRPTFAALRELRDELEFRLASDRRLPFLSMGMSGDFEIAIEEGATHVRIGSSLFDGVEGNE